MRNYTIALLLLMTSFLSFANSDGGVIDPVSWTNKLVHIEGNKYMVRFDAVIEEHWHVYSNDIAEGGPIPTTFGVDEFFGGKLVGGLKESGKIEKAFNDLFEMELKWYNNEVTFYQIIEIEQDDAKIKGYLQYMTCDDKQCLPPTYVDINYDIKKNASDLTEEDEILLYGKKEESKSLLGILLAGFIGGLIALLTPCVFPMIPLTVSFFTKQSKTRSQGIMNAFIYGGSIIGIYLLLGFGVSAIFGPSALNAMSTNPWFNVGFFILFIVFAASFFGAFEITLPASWINKSDSAADKGGLIGIFFMAFTLSLVSFSCTGPIIGTLLVKAATGGQQLAPIAGMGGFAFALALPFGLFAAFPGWLNSLPKSGGWLNTVKVVLGFIEVALALKFLSVADLVMHWGILDREVFIVLWVIIFALLGFYLLGKLKFSHDSDLPYISVPRLFMAIISFAFALYLIPGLWGAPLKAISAFAPPIGTQDFVLSANSHATPPSEHAGIVKKNSDNLHCPHNLDCFFDYDQALEVAKQTGKPLMVDFTGHGCVNCRKMEASVWSDPNVLNRLSQDYILVSLYVDDRTPIDEPYVEEDGTKIRTIGDKWSYFQTIRFKRNSQPFYILLDHDENELTTSRGYNEDLNAYIDFLDIGIENFKNR